MLPTPKQNRILAALPGAAYDRILPDLELLPLDLGEFLDDSPTSAASLYFPITAIVALVATSPNDESVATAMTGNDGVVGVATALGGEMRVQRWLVQSAGQAYRLRPEIARWEFAEHEELRQLVLEYVQMLICQMAQTALCMRRHSVGQQLCRWLLLSLDRHGSDELQVTQALLASLLGVRREAVSEIAGELQAAGLIRYVRGRLSVLDRDGLAARACECHAVIRQAGERSLPPAPNALNRLRPRSFPTAMQARQRDVLPPADAVATADNEGLLHRLRAQQRELQLRNEEIANAYAEADALVDRYSDLYDFSPVAYLTIDALGVIRQTNLAGAILLGLKRSRITRHRFVSSVAPPFRPLFEQFLGDVLAGQAKRQCEIELAATAYRPLARVTIDAIADESGQECRMVVSDVTAQRAAEHALRVREQYLRAVLDNFPFMVWLKDPDSRFLAVNRPFADNFDQPSPESLIGKSDLDIATRELAEAYRADDRAVLDSGRQKNVEEWVERHGRRVWHETFKSPISVDGQLIGTVGFARDITARKAAEAREKSRARVLERITSRAPVAEVLEAIVHGAEHENPAMLCSALLLGEDDGRLHTGAAPSLPAFFNTAVDGLAIGIGVGCCGTAAFTGQRIVVGDIASHPYWAPYRELARRAGLGACWSEPIRSSQGKVLGTFAIYHRHPHRPSPADIALIEEAAGLASIAIETERAERTLRESEKRFRDVAQVSADWIWEIDSAARYTYASDGVQALLGHAPAEIIGKTIFELMPPDEAMRVRDRFAAIALRGEPFRDLENVVLDVHGGRHVALANGTPIRDGRGRVVGYRGVSRDVTKRKQLEEHLHELASTDLLTGLPNRRQFIGRMEEQLARVKRTPAHRVMLLFLDLDYFKRVNDKYGHAAGDIVLREFAALLAEDLRRMDSAARIGGEEFAVLLPETDLAAALVLARRLRERVARTRFSAAGGLLGVTVSIGVAAMNADDESIDATLLRADRALYGAKHRGRNRVVCCQQAKAARRKRETPLRPPVS